MANVIAQSDYREIAIAYGNARTTVLAAKQHLFDAVYLIVLLQSVRPEAELLPVFWDTYNLNVNTLETPTLLLSAVRSLNNHVLIAGGFASVDAYLEAGNVTVPQAWADLSAQAGYVIDPANIG